MRRFCSFSFAFLALALSALLGGVQVAYAQALPTAQVKIWPAGGAFGGADPDESVVDITGLTAQVATPQNPLTIVTSWDSGGCGSCAITYLNPATNTIRCEGFSAGFIPAVDINRRAPVKTSTSPSAATFQPGDAWVSSNSPGIHVNFKGTGNFRSYNRSTPWGVKVDQNTGNVWYAQQNGGALERLDPATNSVTQWLLGGTSPKPFYVALDSSGRVYTTVGCDNQIARLDPATNVVTKWAVPTAGGLTCSGAETPNGIFIDAGGNVWFSETAANKIGRLNPATNAITEFTKTGLQEPLLIATSGSGDLLQAFFTEGTGNAVSIVTQREAVGTTTTVTPTTSTVTPSTLTVSPTDFTSPPRTTTMTPSVFTIQGVDGTPDALGTTRTSAGERVPGILRFPLATTGQTGPSGMSDLDVPNTVFGSFFSSSKLFQLTSGAAIAPPPGAGTLGSGGAVTISRSGVTTFNITGTTFFGFIVSSFSGGNGFGLSVRMGRFALAVCRSGNGTVFVVLGGRSDRGTASCP